MPQESAARKLTSSIEVGAETSSSGWLSNRTRFWVGWVLTAMPVLLLAAGAAMAFFGSPQMEQELVNRFGYPPGFAPVLGFLELACVLVYAIPRTAVLGAILLTGYLGGAIATHVRIGDPSYLIPLGLAMIVWGGIYFRDDRLRAVLPLRRGN